MISHVAQQSSRQAYRRVRRRQKGNTNASDNEFQISLVSMFHEDCQRGRRVSDFTTVRIRKAQRLPQPHGCGVDLDFRPASANSRFSLFARTCPARGPLPNLLLLAPHLAMRASHGIPKHESYDIRSIFQSHELGSSAMVFEPRRLACTLNMYSSRGWAPCTDDWLSMASDRHLFRHCRAHASAMPSSHAR